MTRAALYTRHVRLADAIARECRVPGVDRDDVAQEARIALWVATGSWDRERGPFVPFARLVVKRRVADLLEAATRHKALLLTRAARVGVNDDGDVEELVGLLSDGKSAEDRAVLLDELRGLVGAILGLTAAERRAIVRVIDGAELESKSDDCARYRARRKLRKAVAA